MNSRTRPPFWTMQRIHCVDAESFASRNVAQLRESSRALLLFAHSCARNAGGGNPSTSEAGVPSPCTPTFASTGQGHSPRHPHTPSLRKANGVSQGEPHPTALDARVSLRETSHLVTARIPSPDTPNLFDHALNTPLQTCSCCDKEPQGATRALQHTLRMRVA